MIQQQYSDNIVLEENAVRLRPFRMDDAGALAALANNKKIWDNVRDSLPYPYSRRDAEYFINLQRKEKIPATFAIEYNGNIAGVIGLVRQSDVYRLTAELGYWLGEPFWNKGICTKAVALIVRYGFEKIGLQRIYANVFDFNKASQRVLEKAGFELECISKKAAVKNGVICSEYKYSIIAGDDSAGDGL